MRTALQPVSSPLETAMADALGDEMVRLDPAKWHTVNLSFQPDWSFGDFPPLWTAGIVIGREIKIGPYRADFGIIVRAKGGIPAHGAIECDGHTYHDRTPAQAMHDRSRDRYFLECGVYTIRFTGEEIRTDVKRCARQVLGILGKASRQ